MLGNVVGSLIGGYLASQGFSPQKHFIYVGSCCLPVSIFAYFWLLPLSSEQKILATTSGGSDSQNTSTTTSSYQYSLQSQENDEFTHSTDYFTTTLSCDNTFLENERDVLLMDNDDVVVVHSSGNESTSPLLSSHDNSNSNNDSNNNRDETIDSLNYSPQKIIQVLCLLGFICEVIIGTVTDWSTVYFKDDLETTTMISTVGFAMFSICGSCGMILSDTLVKKYFRKSVVCCCGLLSLFGLGLTSLSGFVDIWYDIDYVVVVIAIIGLAITGGATSCIIPIIFSSAGDVPNYKPAESVSRVTSISYLAYLLGPPIFGSLSDVFGSLKYIYIILSCLSVFLFLLTDGIPHNRYGLIKLMTTRSHIRQHSTDFFWQNESCDHHISQEVTAGNDGDQQLHVTGSRINNPTSPANSTRSSGVLQSSPDKIRAIDKHLTKNKYPVF